MSTSPNSKYRPAPEHRWTSGMRTDPVRLNVRTEWLYNGEPGTTQPGGHSPWPFARGGDVVSSNLPSPQESQQDLTSQVHRAVEVFGDDKNLVVEVRLAETAQPKTPAGRDPKDLWIMLIYCAAFALSVSLIVRCLVVGGGPMAVMAALGWLTTSVYAGSNLMGAIRTFNARSAPDTSNASNTPNT